MPKKIFNNKPVCEEFECELDIEMSEKDVKGAIEDAFLDLIDYTPRSKVEIVFKNTSALSFFYWTPPKEFIQLWNGIKGHEVNLIVCDHQIVSFDKRDVLYKRVSEVFEGQQ